MTPDAQERMQQLFRQVKIGQELPSFLAGVSRALGTPVDTSAVLPLDRSESMQRDLSVRIREGLHTAPGPQHRLLPRAEQAQFEAEFARLVQCFNAESAVLSLGTFSALPLLQVAASTIAGRFHDLWRMGDTVTVASLDLQHGFMADSYPDDAEQGFEIVSWGLDASWT